MGGFQRWPPDILEYTAVRLHIYFEIPSCYTQLSCNRSAKRWGMVNYSYLA